MTADVFVLVYMIHIVFVWIFFDCIFDDSVTCKQWQLLIIIYYIFTEFWKVHVWVAFASYLFCNILLNTLTYEYNFFNLYFMLTLQAANFSEYRLVQKSPLQSFREGRAILFRIDSSMLICFLYMRSRQIQCMFDDFTIEL